MLSINPLVATRQIIHPENGKTFTICDDGICVGGTKQRLLASLLPTISQNEIVLVGTPLGLAQVALSSVCQTLHKKSFIFLVGPKQTIEQENPLTQFARAHNTTILYASDVENCRLYDLLEQANVYVSKDPQNRYLLPVGLKGPPDSPTFIHFRTALTEALSHITEPPKRLWIASGTGFLGNVLHSIWPDTEFMIVLPDTAVWNPEEVRNRKHQLFYCTQAFHEHATTQPPYESIPWYDAKVWEFVLKYGENGDFIWNVGKCPTV